MTFLVDRAGIVGEDGKTHQGVFDVSFLYPLENSIIACPTNPSNLKGILKCFETIKGPKFVRYQKMVCKKNDDICDVSFAKFIVELVDVKNPVSIIVVGHSLEIIKEIRV